MDDPSSANPTAELDATTTYTVTVTDENGCEATDQVTVTVQSNLDVVTEQCAAVQDLIDNPQPSWDPGAIGHLQDAKTALNDAAAATNLEDFLDAIRDAAEALEEARDEHVDSDPIAVVLADLARHIATEKKEEALDCDPSPTGKMQDDIDDGDSDLADGDVEYNDPGGPYYGDAIKDYKKAWENYCSALCRCSGLCKTAEFDEHDQIQALPTDFALHQNYPNPFNPSTTIQFDLVEVGHVSLSIYNSAGQLVRTLVSGDYAPGAHKVVWDAHDDSGARVASGLYLYTIKVGQQFTAQKKLLLMK